MFIYNIHFRINWKLQENSFNHAIKYELEPIFKVVDNGKSDEHGKSFIKYEYKPEKIQSPLTNLVVFDLETFNKSQAVPCASGKYSLNKISGKYNRDVSEKNVRNVQ